MAFSEKNKNDMLSNKENSLSKDKRSTLPEISSVRDEYPIFIKSNEIISVPYDKYFRLLYKPDSKLLQHLSTEVEEVTMETKMKEAAPYSIFYNTLKLKKDVKQDPNSISLTDILCPSLGKLKYSLQINENFDVMWLIEQYAMRKLHKTPITVLCQKILKLPGNETMKELYPNIEYHIIKVEDKLGSHESKIGIYYYHDDSLRVVVGANLSNFLGTCHNHEIWISPPCQKLPESSSVEDGESPTGFKSALIDYLLSYNNYEIPSLAPWIEHVKRTDFSQIKVVLIYSTPGYHGPEKNGSHLHFLGHILSKHCVIPAPKEEHHLWRIVVQTYQIGLMGKNLEEWLIYLLKSLESNQDNPYHTTSCGTYKGDFSIIFPTLQNYLDGNYKEFPWCYYSKQRELEQPWIKDYMYQWKAHEICRAQYISNSNIFFRISPCWQKLVYYFLTSSALLRSSWGLIPQEDLSTYLRSYELGILFLPKFFGEEYFEVRGTINSKNDKLFPIMCDLPLTPYKPDDECCYNEIALKKELITVGNTKPEEVNLDSNQSKKTVQIATNNELKEETVLEITHPIKEESENVTEKEGNDQRIKINLNPKPQNLFFPSFNKKP